MKALYLDAINGVEVTLDGPSLRVRRPARADRRCPLVRISRIITIGVVNWRADALAACLRHGKPVAVLDRAGRFVRILFRPRERQMGLARHMGELLEVPRFQKRYRCWFEDREKKEIATAIRGLRLSHSKRTPEKVWQAVNDQQARRWGGRPARSYRYLQGLAAAQLSSAFASFGMPRDPGFWGCQEFRFFKDVLQLERWRLALLLEGEFATLLRLPRRLELVARFEADSPQREARFARWRQNALVAMMGILGRGKQSREVRPVQTSLEELGSDLVARSRRVPNLAGNRNRIPFGARGSLRTSIRILRVFLDYDRRRHGPLRKT